MRLLNSITHLTAAAAEIPRNPLEDVREKVVKTLEGSLHPRELTELVSVVQKTHSYGNMLVKICTLTIIRY